MKRVTEDSVLSLKEKQRILKELKQDDLIELFKKGYKTDYKKVEPRKQPLDQQINITLDVYEKNMIAQELRAIKSIGSSVSLSSFIRNRVTSLIDIEDWGHIAEQALIDLKDNKFDVKYLKRKRQRLLLRLDNADNETSIVLKNKIKEIENLITSLDRTKAKRQYRISCRLTYQEANEIRWKAARLSLSIADYMRFSIFGYLPNSSADKCLTLENRKRFYVSILDVQKNGWGKIPGVEVNSETARLNYEINVLRTKVDRYEALIKSKGLTI